MTAPVSAEFGPYSSAVKYFDSDVSWVPDEDDKLRIRAYDLYDKMYWNEPGWAKLYTRGEEDEDYREIYLPSPQKLVEAVNRFLGLDMGYSFPEDVDKTLQDAAKLALDAFFERERVKVKFIEAKRGMLKLGDYLWHLTADEAKEAGKRISLHLLEPSSYFPIYGDSEFPTRLTGCHLVEVIEDPRDDKKTIVRRQTYLKNGDVVTSSLTYWEVDKWDDRTLDEDDLVEITDIGDLPTWEKVLEGIPSIPVYLFDNVSWGDHPFGISELRGLENAIAAINQAISDEDLALVMQGLGTYWSDAGPPEDDEGTPTKLVVSPNTVLEVPEGNKIGRLSGVSSVAPMLEHINHISNDIMSSRGISDIAAGKVDVAVAESGISLYLQLAPLLAKNSEKELKLAAVLNNVYYDLLNYWFPKYDGIATAGARALATFKDPIPENREKVINEVILLMGAGLITTDMAIGRLSKLGWVYPQNAAAKLLEEKKARVAAETPVDPFAERAGQEAAGNNEQE
jgi:hypothetical protein